jgi:hypothetical protein
MYVLQNLAFILILGLVSSLSLGSQKRDVYDATGYAGQSSGSYSVPGQGAYGSSYNGQVAGAYPPQPYGATNTYQPQPYGATNTYQPQPYGAQSYTGAQSYGVGQSYGIPAGYATGSYGQATASYSSPNDGGASYGRCPAQTLDIIMVQTFTTLASSPTLGAVFVTECTLYDQKNNVIGNTVESGTVSKTLANGDYRVCSITTNFFLNSSELVWSNCYWVSVAAVQSPHVSGIIGGTENYKDIKGQATIAAVTALVGSAKVVVIRHRC